MKTQLSDLDPFLRGYVIAALFTTDPNGPGGCEYSTSGRPEELFPRIPEEFLTQAREDCADFQTAQADLLKQAGDEEQNGTDFWLTRNGHGAGFWDRGYDVGRELSDACKPYGEHYLELGGWWLQSYACECGEQWARPEDADNDPEYGTDTCDACGASVESDNRKYGEHLTAIDEPEE